MPESSSLTELQVRIDCNLECKQGKNGAELIGWQFGDTCKLIFPLAGKNRGRYKYVFTVQRAGNNSPEKHIRVERKVQLS